MLSNFPHLLIIPLVSILKPLLECFSEMTQTLSFCD